jgi:ubiquinone/menaquinone biosynthesis C-methylase UbiE
MKSSEQKHLDLVRERFTATADPFAETVQSRGDVVVRTAALATAGYPHVSAALALDVACGPATFARGFAPIVGRVVGVDFTPAMLTKARRVVGEAGLANVEFVRGDGNALPFADGTFDLAQCTYAFHHFPEPAKVLGEMARVVRKGGRVTVVDAIIPEGADREWNDRIERLRDVSHARMLTDARFRELFQAAGLRVIASEVHTRERDFDDWMYGAGWAPGSLEYKEVRGQVEASADGDRAGFGPHFHPESGALLVKQSALVLVGEKP